MPLLTAGTRESCTSNASRLLNRGFLRNLVTWMLPPPSCASQVKAYSCSFEAPQEFADAVQPGAFIQCNTSNTLNTSQTPAVSGAGVGGSCTFGLVAAGDPIVCTGRQCTAKPNSTVLQCQASGCVCSLSSGCASSEPPACLPPQSATVAVWALQLKQASISSAMPPGQCLLCAGSHE